MPLPFVMRDAHEGDEGFVFDSWMRGMRKSPASRGIPGEYFWSGQRDTMHALLEHATVVIACDAQMPNALLYGCVVYGPNDEAAALHWVYVKSAFTRMGVARALLSLALPPTATKRVCTQATKDFAWLGPKYGLELVRPKAFLHNLGKGHGSEAHRAA
jgi:hypothetical protein